MLTFRYLWVALAFGVLVVMLPSLTWWWLGLFLLLGAVDIALCASPRTLRIERLHAPSVRLTSSAEAETKIVNLGRRALRGWAKDGWQPTAGAQNALQRVTVPSRGERILHVNLCPTRRGDIGSEHITVRSVGPLGLAGRQVTHRVPHSLRVLPEFRSRKHLPSKLQRLRELDGAAAVQLRGAGTEFDSLRDYVRGDDVRSIDWRATARRQDAAGQHLVVRTWRPERDRRVILCLDASRTAAARIGNEPRLDAGIEASLLLGALASSGGDRVDFFAFQRQVVARASSAQRGEFLSTLGHAAAGVEPALVEADFSQLPAEVAAVSPHQSLVVVLTAVDSPALQEGLMPVLPALAAKHRVVVASVRDPELSAAAARRETATEVYQAAAAERAQLQAEAVTAELASLGVEVIHATPEELPPALSDTYLRLKATGKL